VFEGLLDVHFAINGDLVKNVYFGAVACNSFEEKELRYALSMDDLNCKTDILSSYLIKALNSGIHV
jgi:hypothetical protein